MDRRRGRRHSFTLAAAAAVWLLAAGRADAARLTSLRIDSEAGDLVGRGESYFYDADDGTFRLTRNNLNGLWMFFQTPGLSAYWSLQFVAPGNAVLAPGLYAGAGEFIGFPSASPLMSVSGYAGHCDNGLSGSFEVLEAAY